MSIARAFLVAVTLATPALSQDLATADAIRAAVAGNTVQGSMLDSGAYTEFYAADGTIHGDGYEGAWTVDGDTMCFAYGEDPATCWQVRLSGDQVAWIQEGAERGTGTIVSGNPNGF
jgi:hypothetical protein